MIRKKKSLFHIQQYTQDSSNPIQQLFVLPLVLVDTTRDQNDRNSVRYKHGAIVGCRLFQYDHNH